MKRGEKIILGVIAAVVLALMGRNLYRIDTNQVKDKGIPYYSTASAEMAHEAKIIYDANGCKECHSLWTVRDIMRNVPAPILDGMGSLHSEEWFYTYFSSPNPQEIIPSRLKKEYRMPSYRHLPEHQRRVLAAYMASLKVKDWYLEETRKAEYEKLTGKKYKP